MKYILTTIIAALFMITMSAQETTTTTPEAPAAATVYKSSAKGNLPKMEVMPFGGYMFGGKIKFYDGNFDIKGNGNYGVALGFPVERIVKVELSYFRMDTKGVWYHNRNATPPYNQDKTLDMAMQYFQIGVVKTASLSKVKPFGLISLGATWFDLKDNSNLNDLWAFSAVFGAGVRVDMNEHVALRLQGRFMAPMYFDGLGIGIGTGGVSGGAVFGTYALQGDFSAGLIFKIW